MEILWAMYFVAFGILRSASSFFDFLLVCNPYSAPALEVRYRPVEPLLPISILDFTLLSKFYRDSCANMPLTGVKNVVLVCHSAIAM